MNVLYLGNNEKKNSGKYLNRIEARFAEGKQKMNSLKIKLQKQWRIQNFLGKLVCVQFSISLRCHHGQCPCENLKKLVFLDQGKLYFWILSCTLFADHLCHLFCYQVSCFRACLHYVQYSPYSQGTENLVSEFPGYVRKKRF